MTIDADVLNASILIVDDQAPNVGLLQELLGAAGYTRVASTMNPPYVSPAWLATVAPARVAGSSAIGLPSPSSASQEASGNRSAW